TPPVIHRDLKPSNILIDPATGRISLIDFGIARSFTAGLRDDTVLAGTRRFAPPEQYGFGQTDARTDIYALGIVLCWLLTGQTSVQGMSMANRLLARVIRKCAAFSPNDRYRSALALGWALTNVDGHRQRRLLRAIAFALALFAAAAGGFAIGRFTDVRPAIFYGTPYAVFSDPLVEQAVRLQLGKAVGEPILREELDQVTELYIYRDQTVATQEEFYALRNQVDSGEIAVGEGTISAPDDIAQLKNLHILCVGYQPLDDISAIGGLTGLMSLQLYALPISSIEAVRSLPKLQNFVMDLCDGVTDISPLADCPVLNQLVMTGCKAEDFSVLTSLGDIDFIHLQNVDPAKFLPYLQGKRVRQLKIGSASLPSLSGLSGIAGLEDLIIDDMEMNSLEGAQALTDLKYLTLLHASPVDLTPLLSLSSLQTLTLSEDMREAAQSVEGAAGFSINWE
ncbi:MAG: protein kinase, partial [Bacillota bacterium]